MKSPGPDTSVGYRRRWYTLVTLSTSLLIIGLDNTVLNVAIPTLQREFNATATTLQWMIDAYIPVFAGLLLTMGSLGDVRAEAGPAGRDRRLRPVKHAGRLRRLERSTDHRPGSMGIGGALIMPSALSIITNVFPREERGKAIGMWAALAGMGIGLGPLLGGYLLERFWWGSVFFINIPIAVAGLAAGVFLVPESRDPDPPRLDILGALLSIAAVSVLVYAIFEAPALGWTDGVVVVGVLLLGLFVYWERRIDHPMLNLAFFKNPRFSGGVGANSVGFFSLFGIIFGLALYLQFVQGYTPLEAGVRMIPLPLGMVVGAGAGHRLVGRLGTNRVVAMGLLILSGLLVSFSFWEPDTEYRVLGVSFFVMAYGMGNLMAPSTDAVMGAVPEANAGIASAMNDVTRMVAGAFGVAVTGSAINTAYGNTMADALEGLPRQAAEAAGDSVGAAVNIAANLPGEAAARLADTARTAFTDALGIAVLISAGVALLGAALIRRFMPARHLPNPGQASSAPDAT